MPELAQVEVPAATVQSFGEVQTSAEDADLAATQSDSSSRRRVLFSPEIAAYRPFLCNDPVFASDIQYRYAKMTLANFVTRRHGSPSRDPVEWTGEEGDRTTTGETSEDDMSYWNGDVSVYSNPWFSARTRSYDSDPFVSTPPVVFGRKRPAFTDPNPSYFYHQATVKNLTLELMHVKNYPILRGVILVRNLAFEKNVTVRISVDAWATYEDIPASFLESVAPAEIAAGFGPYGKTQVELDRFAFSYTVPKSYFDLADLGIRQARLPIEMALRYQINGQEMWDNNGRANYSFRISRALDRRGMTRGLYSTHRSDTGSMSDTEVIVQRRLRPSLKTTTSLLLGTTSSTEGEKRDSDQDTTTTAAASSCDAAREEQPQYYKSASASGDGAYREALSLAPVPDQSRNPPPGYLTLDQQQPSTTTSVTWDAPLRRRVVLVSRSVSTLAFKNLEERPWETEIPLSGTPPLLRAQSFTLGKLCIV